MENIDYIFKIVIVGQSGVGKTSILLRYTDLKYPESHVPTIGVEFKIKHLQINEKRVKLQMWDTAGQERFHSLATSYFKGAHAAVFVFALDDIGSFSKLNYWIELVDEKKIEHKFLVGNKCDIGHRDVTDELIKGFLQNRPDITYMEVSAKTGVQIDDAFMKLATELLEKAMLRRQEVDKDVIQVEEQLHVNECESRTGNWCCGGTG